MNFDFNKLRFFTSILEKETPYKILMRNLFSFIIIIALKVFFYINLFFFKNCYPISKEKMLEQYKKSTQLTIVSVWVDTQV